MELRNYSQNPQIQKYKNIIAIENTTLKDFLKDLDNFLSETDPKVEANCDSFVSKISLFNELEALQKDNDEMHLFIDKTLSLVKINCRDHLNQKHTILLSRENNGSYKFKQHTLPDIDEFSAIFKDVITAVDLFKQTLTLLCYFLEALADIDSSCWVIDPLVPSTKDNYRRIVIGEGVSAQVTVSHRGAWMPPLVDLVGPERFTEPIESNMRDNDQLWDHDLSMSANLLNLFGIPEFPCKQDLLMKQVGVEPLLVEMDCGICMSDRDTNGNLPAIACEMELCQHMYHNACLYQWLSMLSGNRGNRLILGIIRGDCPSCSTSITCPIPDETKHPIFF